jgi:hypothetical protein
VIPEKIRCFCALCPHEAEGIEAIVAHLEQVHGCPSAERWPDGGLVIDASDTPELLAVLDGEDEGS